MSDESDELMMTVVLGIVICEFVIVNVICVKLCHLSV